MRRIGYLATLVGDAGQPPRPALRPPRRLYPAEPPRADAAGLPPKDHGTPASAVPATRATPSNVNPFNADVGVVGSRVEPAALGEPAGVVHLRSRASVDEAHSPANQGSVDQRRATPRPSEGATQMRAPRRGPAPLAMQRGEAAATLDPPRSTRKPDLPQTRRSPAQREADPRPRSRVTIGTIEVTVVPPPAPPRAQPRAAPVRADSKRLPRSAGTVPWFGLAQR